MSSNKMIVPGFGTGASFGTPTTISLAETSTLSITASLVGGHHAVGLVAGITLTQVSTSNGVTGTYTILSAAPGYVWLDGVSGRLVNTTTSVSITMIGV